MTINGEVNSSGMALTSRRHGLVKVNHYSRIEKSTWSHERLERVAMNEPLRILKFDILAKVGMS